MKCDIVFLAHGRPEFSAASLRALAINTNWDRVKRLWIYTDGDALREGCVGRPPIPLCVLEYDHLHYGGPVNIMSHYLAHNPSPVWAKIDNDVIVPPGWLDAGLDVMEASPELSFLGIEPPASRTRSPWGGKLPPAPEADPAKLVIFQQASWTGYAKADAIGGVGFMRTSAWEGRVPMVQHSRYGGFTDWQLGQSDLVKGWIVPPLKLFLLDRLPIDPWASLSAKYVAVGEQRFWTRYDMGSRDDLWGWWEK